MMKEIGTLIEQIRNYTNAHTELRRAHHFNFDLRHGAAKDVRYVIMGLNPGVGKEWKDYDKNTHSCREATSESDYYLSYKPREETNWFKRIQRLLPNEAGFTQTERFFWSSTGGIKNFKSNFNTRLSKSPHLEFCKDINNSLIEIYRPQAVICTGLAGLKTLAKLYGLSGEKRKKNPRTGNTLMVHFKDQRGINWICIPHLTGSRGLSNTDMKRIKRLIEERTSHLT